MPVTLYGFKACDSVQKARKWLDAHGVEHRFVDYRVEKLDPKTVDGWFVKAGWEKVLNRNSTTFRELPDAQKTGIDESAARKLILSETNLIKRPVLEADGELAFGFKPEIYEKLLG